MKGLDSVSVSDSSQGLSQHSASGQPGSVNVCLISLALLDLCFQTLKDVTVLVHTFLDITTSSFACITVYKLYALILLF